MNFYVQYMNIKVSAIYFVTNNVFGKKICRPTTFQCTCVIFSRLVSVIKCHKEVPSFVYAYFIKRSNSIFTEGGPQYAGIKQCSHLNLCSDTKFANAFDLCQTSEQILLKAVVPSRAESSGGTSTDTISELCQQGRHKVRNSFEIHGRAELAELQFSYSSPPFLFLRLFSQPARSSNVMLAILI